MQGKRVFVLGAGFSKHAGLPLVDNLFKETLEFAENNTEYNKANLDMITEALNLTYPFPDNHVGCLNIEDFLSVLVAFQDLWKSNDATRANYFNEVYRLTLIALIEYMWSKITEANVALVSKFLKVAQGDTIITLNWDTLIEKAAEESVLKYHLLSDLDTNDGGFLYLKLHGSMNWIELDDEFTHHPELFDKIGRLHIFKGLDKIDFFMPLNRPPAMVPPTLWKNYDVLQGFWHEALTEIRAADEVVIIGYSFPYFDFPIRALTRSSLNEKRRSIDQPSDKKTIRVINPDKHIHDSFEHLIASNSEHVKVIFELSKFEDCSIMQ